MSYSILVFKKIVKVKVKVKQSLYWLGQALRDLGR